MTSHLNHKLISNFCGIWFSWCANSTLISSVYLPIVSGSRVCGFLHTALAFPSPTPYIVFSVLRVNILLIWKTPPKNVWTRLWTSVAFYKYISVTNFEWRVAYEGKANQADLGSLSTKTLSVIHLPGMTSTQQLLWAQIKKSSICPPFFASLFLFSASLSVVVGCLAVLMEMPAVWLLTPHQVHLLKWQSHLPGRRPLPSSLN